MDLIYSSSEIKRIKNKLLSLKVNKNTKCYHYEFDNYTMRIEVYNNHNKIIDHNLKQYDFFFYTKDGIMLLYNNIFSTDFLSKYWYSINGEVTLETLIKIIIYLEKLDKLKVFL